MTDDKSENSSFRNGSLHVGGDGEEEGEHRGFHTHPAGRGIRLGDYGRFTVPEHSRGRRGLHLRRVPADAGRAFQVV